MWRKREIMELQNKARLEDLINDVPTDVSGKWVNKDELKPFAMAVMDYVLTRIERKANDPAL
jgi:hypothetical protein